ncbi:MAG: hypothetical protein JSS66_18915 [Armatimonadetes bacterium]|nr:hypothetical protein [Armatimonadota bacterium]
MTMTTQHEHTVSAHIAAIETRVDGLEKGMRTLAEGINALGTKIDARAQTQWTPIWSAAGVAVAILASLGGALYAPVNSNMQRLELQLERLREAELPRAEYDARSSSEVQRREAAFAALRDSNARQDGEIVRLRDSQVTRSEHERVWNEQIRNRERIEHRLDRLEERQMKP